MPQRRQPSTARKSGTKPVQREEISTKREDGIYCLANEYYKVLSGKLTYIDDTLLTKETGEIVKKRIRRAKNEDGLLEFVLDSGCTSDYYINIEYVCKKEVVNCYAIFNWCDEKVINVDLYDRQVVHKNCTSYKCSDTDITIGWKDICTIYNRCELPMWTPEDTPNCSTCSRSGGEESEVDEDYEDSVGEGSIV